MKTTNRSEHVSRHSSGLKLDTPLLVVLLHPSATAHTAHTHTLILRLALNTVWWVAPFLRSYLTKITVRGSLILWLLFLLAHQDFRIIVLLCNCKLALHQVHHASGMNLFYLAPSLSPLPLSLSPSPSLPLSLPHPFPLSPSPSLAPPSPSLTPPLQIVCHGKTVEEVTCHLGSLAPPFLTFRDASCGPPSYPLTLYHCFSAVYKVQTIPHGRNLFPGLLLSCPVRGLTSLLDIQERTVLYSVKVGSKQQRKLSHTFCLACVYLLTKVHRKLWQID